MCSRAACAVEVSTKRTSAARPLPEQWLLLLLLLMMKTMTMLLLLLLLRRKQSWRWLPVGGHRPRPSLWPGPRPYVMATAWCSTVPAAWQSDSRRTCSAGTSLCGCSRCRSSDAGAASSALFGNRCTANRNAHGRPSGYRHCRCDDDVITRGGGATWKSISNEKVPNFNKKSFSKKEKCFSSLSLAVSLLI